ncbi:UDP-Glycosyltransferase/glycogen phosphorylase [Fistulina hepatica ATCC 64428]|nr:UDP-Glycosyltransferase/glycogen phosphorylase [Fistulina hepatica ATCC 64428]
MPFGRLYLSLHEYVGTFFAILAGLSVPPYLRCLNHLEGLITPTSRALEPLTCFHIETYLRRRHAFLYPIGPLLPPSSGLKSSKNNKATQSTAGKIEQFLNSHLSHKGERSVLYIAFGSVFFPRPAENLWAFLDVVVELDIPFILARPQSHAIKSSVLPTIPEVPDNILASLAANENTGVICDWAPQQFILSHPATGWFLTHCGINSVQESLLCGVPMLPSIAICGDQPLLAIRLIQELGCGIELNEVHSGHGKKRRTSNDVTPWPVEVQTELVKDEARSVLNTVFFGEDGRLVWQRALQMKTKLQRAWDKHGDARKSLRRFILDFMTE